MDTNSQLYAGVDVGGTNIAVALVTGSGETVVRNKNSTPRGGAADAVLEAIAETVEGLLAKGNRSVKDLSGIGLGVAGLVNPVEGVVLYTANMDPTELKAEFGAHMCFHGGISIQNVLETGTPESVAREVRRVIAALAPGGGYILAPTHWIQSGTPVENVLTMYEVAKEYSTAFYRKRRT